MNSFPVKAHRVFGLTTASLVAWISLLATVACGCDPHDDHGSAHSVTSAKSMEGKHGDEHDHDHDEHADEVKLLPDAIRRNGIAVESATTRPLVETITAPARLAYNAEAIAHVGAAVAGRINELKVRVGEAVKKGDALAIIDSPDLGEAQSDFLQKRTAADIAKPAIDLAKSAYERAQRLYDEQQGISLTEVQSRQREYQSAVGSATSAQTAATAAENRLHLLGMDQPAVAQLVSTKEINAKYVIHAPIDGRVIERAITLGELVGPDREKLLVIADLSTIWVLADVPEARLTQLSEGAAAHITVTAGGSHAFPGTVAYISPELDPATRTARVRIAVPNPDMRLRPGMYAEVEIATDAAGGEPIVAVPEDAIHTVEGEPAIFVPVEDEPNTFARRAVTVGRPVGGWVPVLNGLKDGEPYVARGSFILKAELGKAGAAHEH
jgi:cobalt-zinc-cadmium efflux system membrane fusion protein